MDQLRTNKEHALKESKHFCMAPWVTMHAWPSGEAYPCCAIQTQGVMNGKGMANLHTSSFEEAWNSEVMRNLRKSTLNDKFNPICKKCVESEQTGNIWTLRTSLNNNFGDKHWERVLATNEDYTHDDPRMLYWDIRFNNLCNMKCRSCSPEFSTQWHADHIEMYGDSGWPMYKGLPKNFWTDILPRITEVEYAYFAGGEPLITEEHYKMLQTWIDAKNTNIKIDYTTNFSKMHLGNKHAFDYWNKLPNVNVGASLDGSWARGEYIRAGTVWQTIVDNRRDMIKECPDTSFFISPTISLYNVLHLPDFHKEWIEEELIHPDAISLANTLFEPDYMKAQNLPDAWKKQVRDKYEKHIEYLNTIGTHDTEKWQNIITFVERKRNKPHHVQLFMDMNLRLDKIRKENFHDTFPELVGIEDAIR